MTSNQEAPKGADVVGEREGLDIREGERLAEHSTPVTIAFVRWLFNNYPAIFETARRLATAEAQLEVYREALERLEMGLQEIVRSSSDERTRDEAVRLLAALREKP